METKPFLDDPGKLLDLVEAVLGELRAARDEPEWRKLERQLREVCKAIDKLETSRTPVPDDLRRLKMELLGSLEGKKDIEARLDKLVEGLGFLSQHQRQPKPRGRPPKNAKPPAPLPKPGPVLREDNRPRPAEQLKLFDE